MLTDRCLSQHRRCGLALRLAALGLLALPLCGCGSPAFTLFSVARHGYTGYKLLKKLDKKDKDEKDKQRNQDSAESREDRADRHTDEDDHHD